MNIISISEKYENRKGVKMKKINYMIIGIILLGFIISVYFYPQMPEQMASHWNINGEVDGYMPKSVALFMMPVITAVMYLMFIILPMIDPLKENVKKFRRYFDNFILIIVAFMFLIHMTTIVWSLGYEFDIKFVIIPSISILIYYAGVLMQHSKQNWFIGIKTPWTLSDKDVWDKTHKMGSKLFKFGAIILLISLLFPGEYFWFMLLLFLTMALYPILYSYLIYKGKKKKR